jgi:uncharacterized membrane protein YcjF (UPF0283 family)
MSFILFGAAVGCCTYSFINYRYNSSPWANSLYFLLSGLVIVIIGLILHFGSQ